MDRHASKSSRTNQQICRCGRYHRPTSCRIHISCLGHISVSPFGKKPTNLHCSRALPKQFAVEEQKTSEKLLKALDSISQIIFRGEEYAKLFSTPSDTSTDRVFQSLQDNLTHLYAEVLNFLVRATTFFKKETIRKSQIFCKLSNTEHIGRYISAGLSSDIKFQPILNQINKYELNVEKDKNLLESEGRLLFQTS